MGGGGKSGPPQAAEPLPEFRPVVKKAGDWLTQHFGEEQQLSPEEQQAMDRINKLWGMGESSGIGPTSLSTLKDVAGGTFLGGQDPYLAQITSGLSRLNAMDRERGISDIEARYGRTGNALSSEAARGVADYGSRSQGQLEQTLGQLNLGAYEGERERMGRAAEFGAGVMPGLGALELQASGITDPARTEDRWLKWLSSILPSGSAVEQFAPDPLSSIIGSIASVFVPGIKK
jgi:hypothetical protein